MTSNFWSVTRPTNTGQITEPQADLAWIAARLFHSLERVKLGLQTSMSGIMEKKSHKTIHLIGIPRNTESEFPIHRITDL